MSPVPMSFTIKWLASHIQARYKTGSPKTRRPNMYNTIITELEIRALTHVANLGCFVGFGISKAKKSKHVSNVHGRVGDLGHE